MICSAKIIELHAAQQKSEPFWNTPFKPGRNVFPIQTSCLSFSIISLFTSALEKILLSFILRGMAMNKFELKRYRRLLNSDHVFPLVLFLCHYKCPWEDTLSFILRDMVIFKLELTSDKNHSSIQGLMENLLQIDANKCSATQRSLQTPGNFLISRNRRVKTFWSK